MVDLKHYNPSKAVANKHQIAAKECAYPEPATQSACLRIVLVAHMRLTSDLKENIKNNTAWVLPRLENFMPILEKSMKIFLPACINVYFPNHQIS